MNRDEFPVIPPAAPAAASLPLDTKDDDAAPNYHPAAAQTAFSAGAQDGEGGFIQEAAAVTADAATGAAYGGALGAPGGPLAMLAGVVMGAIAGTDRDRTPEVSEEEEAEAKAEAEEPVRAGV